MNQCDFRGSLKSKTQSKKHRMLALIRAQADQEARFLAGEFARSASEEREAILAALEFEQWLADGCADALEPL